MVSLGEGDGRTGDAGRPIGIPPWVVVCAGRSCGDGGSIGTRGQEGRDMFRIDH